MRHMPMPIRLYKYNPAGYCGVLMPEKVMKKLARMTSDFENEVKKVLNDNIDDLYEYNWSLAYPNGKQTHVVFATKDDLQRRINLFKARQPEYEAEVYEAKPFSDTAKEIIAQLEDHAKAESKQTN